MLVQMLVMESIIKLGWDELEEKKERSQEWFQLCIRQKQPVQAEGCLARNRQTVKQGLLSKKGGSIWVKLIFKTAFFTILVGINT